MTDMVFDEVAMRERSSMVTVDVRVPRFLNCVSLKFQDREELPFTTFAEKVRLEYSTSNKTNTFDKKCFAELFTIHTSFNNCTSYCCI